jgi:hypothetical protein
MVGSCTWFNENWFNLVQTVGVVGSLLMAAGAANREAKAREIENILTLSAQHQSLWTSIAEKPELQRIFNPDVGVLTEPATVNEELALNEIIAHYLTGWRIANAGGMTSLRELSDDVADFFSLPLPRAVWNKTKISRNGRFVRFVEQALGKEN